MLDEAGIRNYCSSSKPIFMESLLASNYFSAFSKDSLSALFMHIILLGDVRTLDKIEDYAYKNHYDLVMELL